MHVQWNLNIISSDMTNCSYNKILIYRSDISGPIMYLIITRFDCMSNALLSQFLLLLCSPSLFCNVDLLHVLAIGK